MSVRDIRKARLEELLLEDQGNARGKRARLALRLKKAPGQISQWLNGVRTIDEETARAIEVAAQKPRLWLDRNGPGVDALASPPCVRPTAATVIESLGDLLHSVSPDKRAELVNAMSAFVQSGGKAHYQQALIGLLQGGDDDSVSLGGASTTLADRAPVQSRLA